MEALRKQEIFFVRIASHDILFAGDALKENDIVIDFCNASDESRNDEQANVQADGSGWSCVARVYLEKRIRDFLNHERCYKIASYRGNYQGQKPETNLFLVFKKACEPFQDTLL